MRNTIRNNDGYTQLIPLALGIVLIFGLIYVGVYVNGTLSDSLVDTYPTNVASGGAVENSSWYNGTTGPNYYNYSFPSGCTASELHKTNTHFYFQTNGTYDVYLNLTTNGHATNSSSLVAAGTYFNTTLTALLASGNVSAGDTYLNFTTDMNSTENKVFIRTNAASYYQDSDWRNPTENSTVSSSNNITANFDTGLDVLQVAIIITILAAAIAAIFLFTKLRR